ncbi:MAG: hypothetical protein SVU32_04765 [Candidatus Nanohaloarchaea archaeon]|nr:hypothetical protein [Candidatus Nanohaloarchaea archaeon]
MASSDEQWFEHKLGFNRGVLRKSEKFIENDFTKINPRELHRKTRRKIQDLAAEEGTLKFEIKDDPFEVSKEDVGEASGFARGGIKAHFERPDHDGGIIDYKPYAGLGKKLLTLGLLAGIGVAGYQYGSTQASLPLPPPPSYLPHIGAAALLLTLIGLAGMLYSEYETFNIMLVSKLRTLILGEVTEEKIEKEEKTQTQVQGDITMMTAADTDIAMYGRNKYSRLLDKKDVKNPDALAARIDEMRDDIYRQLYLDHYEDIPDPLTEDEVNQYGWSRLRKKLAAEFSEEQVNRWFTEALKDRGIVEDHVIEQLDDDIETVKEEAGELADEIVNYIEKK